MHQLLSSSLSILFSIVLSSISMQSVSTKNDGFFVIAHQCNSQLTLRMAVTDGANAVEMDLQFDEKTGRPTHFYHGSPCDCTCYVVHKLNPFFKMKDNICRIRKPCTQKAGYTDLLDYILKFPTLALVYIDSKIKGLSTQVQEKAAKHLIDTLNMYLFGKRYQGKVLIGSMQPSVYIKKLSEYAASSPFVSRIFITVDDYHKDPTPVINYMKSLHIPNIVVSNGASACYTTKVNEAIKKAVGYRQRGEVCSVIAWTVDRVSSFELYYRSRVNGILTNRVSILVSWAKSKNLRLATVDDDSLTCQVRSVETCECTYQNGGCVVSSPAPPGRACHCSKRERCKATVVTCANLKSQQCINAGTTVQHCVQGHGNCDGYKGQQCDCKRWWWHGCVISKAAPRFTACKCSYNFLTGCHGHVVRCQNPEAEECRHPDKGYFSCRNGGGKNKACGGYKKK